MADTVLRNHLWFWRPNTENKIRSLEHLVQCYYQSVGRNANLVLGLTPDPSGRLPEPDMKRCAEFGAEIRRRFDQPVAETHGTGNVITLDLPRPQRIDHVVIMEEITRGERVRKYAVEGFVSGNAWQPICAGTSIGHKRIEQFKPTEVAKLRLRITASRAAPMIRQLAAFHSEADPKRPV